MAEEGAVIGCHTVEEWNHQLEQAKESNKLVIVDFTATWCGPCRMMAPIFADLAKKFTNAIFLKVDVDELKTVSQEWKIEALPTFIFLKDGAVVEKIVGARKDEIPKKGRKSQSLVEAEDIDLPPSTFLDAILMELVAPIAIWLFFSFWPS